MAWIGPRSVDGGLDEIVIDGVGTGIWLCGKHLVAPDPEAARSRVAESAVDVVCLCQRHEIDERYPDYVEWLEANEGEGAVWRPILDLSAPSVESAQAIAAEINERLDAGRSVIVHCGAGIGRAPTMAIAALLTRGHSLGSLLSAVADSRPMAGPETGDQQDLVKELAANER